MNGRPAPVGIDPLDLVGLDPVRYPALLESSASSAVTGRHDLLPIADGRHLRLDVDGRVRDQDDADRGGDFCAALDRAFADGRDPGGVRLALGSAPAFTGGWLLYLGYEMVGQLEPRLRLPEFRQAPLPVALALRTPAVWVSGRDQGHGVLHGEPGSAPLLAALERDCQRLRDRVRLRPPHLPRCRIEEDEPTRFLDGVGRILAYLAAGDVFQVNLSRAWRARFDEMPDPLALYRRLRRLSPAPFSALLRWQDTTLLSASPERLLRVRDRRIDTRPIAGTRPRGSDPVADAGLRAELIGHPKERAEHVMLIDLERNDLGRICLPGTIRVDELMALESYAHVHHIVSNVSGELRPDASPGAVIRALFPGGTITGCPKVRCMEIIAELEGEGRGPYTGALGYLDRSGAMDLNILIRSAWLHGARLGFRTGAGIVADSDPVRELAETRTKAGGLLAMCGQPGATGMTP